MIASGKGAWFRQWSRRGLLWSTTLWTVVMPQSHRSPTIVPVRQISWLEYLQKEKCTAAKECPFLRKVSKRQLNMRKYYLQKLWKLNESVSEFTENLKKLPLKIKAGKDYLPLEIVHTPAAPKYPGKAACTQERCDKLLLLLCFSLALQTRIVEELLKEVLLP